MLDTDVGICLNGKERFDVEEYCISDGWVRVPADKARDRKGKPVLIKLSGRVDAFYRKSTRDGRAPDAAAGPGRMLRASALAGGRLKPPVQATFSLRRIALPAFGPSLLFGIGEGAILPVMPLTARALGGSVAEAALVVALIGMGSLVSNIPASVLTMRHGERMAIVVAAVVGAMAMAGCAMTGTLAVFALGALVVGTSQAVFNLARQSYLTEAVPVHFRARALSTLGGVMRIGLFIGPFVGAVAVHAGGLAAAYGVGVAALLLAGAVAWQLPELAADELAADELAADELAPAAQGTAARAYRHRMRSATFVTQRRTQIFGPKRKYDEHAEA